MADRASITVTWKSNRIPQVLRQLDDAIDLGLDTWAANVEQQAADAAPYKTGGLRASRYRVSHLTDEFASAVSAFQAANPNAEAAEPPSLVGRGSVFVGFAAGYAAYVNDGHTTASGSFVPANPFFTDTLESEKATIAEALRAAFKKVLGV